MRRILIIGAGDVAMRLIPRLTKKFRVFALVRREDAAAQLRSLGVTPILGDLDVPTSLKRLSGIADVVFHFAPPPAAGATDTRTRHLIAALESARSLPQRVVYISTTGVYGNCHGAWVSETHPLNPATDRARRRVDAEQQLRAWAGRSGVTLSILRAPGIYGDGRLPEARLRAATPVLRDEDDVYTNHIHADDLAIISLAALFRGRPGRVYNASDDSGLKMSDYFDLVADMLSLPRPARISRVEAELQLPGMMMSFMSESRRLNNHRLKKELAIRLAYSTVRAGIKAHIDKLIIDSKH